MPRSFKRIRYDFGINGVTGRWAGRVVTSLRGKAAGAGVTVAPVVSGAGVEMVREYNEFWVPISEVVRDVASGEVLSSWLVPFDLVNGGYYTYTKHNKTEK